MLYMKGLEMRRSKSKMRVQPDDRYVNGVRKQEPYNMLALKILEQASSDIQEYMDYSGIECGKAWEVIKYNAWHAYRWVDGIFPESGNGIPFRVICETFGWDHHASVRRFFKKWDEKKVRLEQLAELSCFHVLTPPSPERRSKHDLPGQGCLFEKN